MKIFFDQNVPRALRGITPDHTTRTADEMAWGRLENGDLIRAAENAGFELFVTTDKNIKYQQNLKTRMISIIEMTTNDWNIIKLHPGKYVAAVKTAKPGSYQVVEYMLPAKRPFTPAARLVRPLGASRKA